MVPVVDGEDFSGSAVSPFIVKTQVDEDDGPSAGLKTLGQALINYGETHFEGPVGQNNSRKGVWSRVLLMCGLFENAVAALYSNPEFHVEAVHLAVALAYYGLLRVPLRSEASEVEIRKSLMTSDINFITQVRCNFSSDPDA